MFAVAPGEMVRLKSALLTLTAAPVWVQVPFQPPFICCHAVGQVKARFQVSIGWFPVLAMSMLPTKPLPQLLVSVKVTAQVDVAGVPVRKVTGGEAHETRPEPSRAITFAV